MTGREKSSTPCEWVTFYGDKATSSLLARGSLVLSGLWEMLPPSRSVHGGAGKHWQSSCLSCGKSSVLVLSTESTQNQYSVLLQCFCSDSKQPKSVVAGTLLPLFPP